MPSDFKSGDGDSPSERERNSASEPERGPRADLFQAFDELPGMASDSITNGRLSEGGTDASTAVCQWIDGDTEAPGVEVILNVIEDTSLHLVLHTGQGACVVRQAEHGQYERVSLLRNDTQVYHLKSEVDEARFGADRIARESVQEWIAEYTGDKEPAYQVTAAALLSPDETDVWEHANRAGVWEEMPV